MDVDDDAGGCANPSKQTPDKAIVDTGVVPGRVSSLLSSKPQPCAHQRDDDAMDLDEKLRTE